jgi:DegV family protein with EDD domain
VTRPVQIITDSTADIPADLLAGCPVTVVPLVVQVAGRSFRDGVDLSREEFVGWMRRGELPRTSQPAIGAFQDVYRNVLEQGYDIVAIHISARLSGTYNASRTAAEAVGRERIRLIDSETVSMGFGWLVVEAAGLATRGGTLDEVAGYVEQRKQDQRVLASLDTLEFLQRGGRIGQAAAFLGSALQVKPIVAVRAGSVEPVERVRTFRRALDRLLALTRQEMPFERLAVMHLGAEQNAAALAARIAADQPSLDIVFSQIGTVIGAYSGPGLVGMAGLVRLGATSP